MKTFAKIFDLPEGQVLVYKDYDVETEEYRLSIKTYTDDHFTVEMSAIYKTIEERDHFFDQYNEEHAKKYVTNPFGVLNI